MLSRLCLALPLLCLLNLTGHGVSANTLERPHLPVLDEKEAQAWPAIGKLNKGGVSSRVSCTGTLIAPDVVLTAAHCTPPDHLSELAAGKRRFVAGWFRGEYVAVRALRKGMRHPAYLTERGHDPRFDVGLVFLAEPITDIAPIPIGQALPETLALVGYHGRIPHMLSGRMDCPVLQQTERLVQIGCPVVSGNSGSPVMFEGPEGDWQIIGVASSQLGFSALVSKTSGWIEDTMRNHSKAPMN